MLLLVAFFAWERFLVKSDRFSIPPLLPLEIFSREKIAWVLILGFLVWGSFQPLLLYAVRTYQFGSLVQPHETRRSSFSFAGLLSLLPDLRWTLPHGYYGQNASNCCQVRISTFPSCRKENEDGRLLSPPSFALRKLTSPLSLLQRCSRQLRLCGGRPLRARMDAPRCRGSRNSRESLPPNSSPGRELTSSLGSRSLQFSCVLFANIVPSITYWAMGFPSLFCSVIGADAICQSISPTITPFLQILNSPSVCFGSFHTDATSSIYIAAIAKPNEQALCGGELLSTSSPAFPRRVADFFTTLAFFSQGSSKLSLR